MHDRLIFHCDCNNFYASCECLEHPEWKHVPLAVAGDPEHRTGVVFAKNEIAKHYGVKTTDTVWQARQKCPDIVFTPPRHTFYAQISARVNAVFREYTELVEPASIDESYLDMTGVPEFIHMTPRALADDLRERIKREIGISISVGVSYNKVFAKLGSDYKKPDATTVLTRDNFKAILWPLPVGDLLFVGKSAQNILSARGVKTIGELALTPPDLLTRWLGKGGEQLWRAANGMDDEPVRPFTEKSEIKSVSRGSTFSHNLSTLDEIVPALSPLVDEVAAALRHHNLKGYVVHLMIKDPSLHTISRQMTLPFPTYLYREIMDAALLLLKTHWPLHQKTPIRALTVGVGNLCDASAVTEQLSLFDDAQPRKQRENQEKLEKAIDAIRKKMGSDAISFGLHRERD